MPEHRPLYLPPSVVEDALAAGVIRLEDKGKLWEEVLPISTEEDQDNG